MKPGKSMDREQLLALCARIKAGDVRARNELVESNIGLAGYFASKFRWTGLPRCDRIQACSLGLLEAASKYDPSRGGFANFASFYVRAQMTRVRALESTVPIPHSALKYVPQYCAAHDELCVDLGRQPSLAEIASRTGWTLAKTARIRAAAATRGPCLEVFPEADETEAQLSCDPSRDTELAATNEASLQAMRQVLDSLSPHEREIVDLWSSGRTVERIVATLRCTREAVEELIREVQAQGRSAILMVSEPTPAMAVAA